jgi:NAD(P)H-quinone oxidoreductase subunit 5
MIQSIHQYACFIPILPSLTASILGFGLLGARRTLNSQRWPVAFVSIFTLMITMFLSIAILYEQVNDHSAHSQVWSWIEVNGWSLQVGYLVDPLSAIMLVVVTSVAVTVMIYTHGYMQHDQGYVRFFMYLTLFTASMLGLVLSPNLVQVYIFWELVGMCSYLLVGFWFTRPSAAYACQKAFVTNRVGDLGLLLGILGLYWLTGSLDFNTIASRIHEQLNTNTVPELWVTLCCICLFLGPIAKSAQFPLHIWLPDAMEGPTPISALIHAATMVAAGVFLVARLLPLFQEVPYVMDFIAYTGAITAFLGATMALAQKDLKKGLAYSTMSQLGYMILALGVGAYQAGLFHLITHAYSKALLFLGSGSVIHGIEPVVGYHPNKCQNMIYMGGLRKYMPITAITFLVGTLSLCGVPPLACFWSKDEILADTWHQFPILGFCAWLTAGLTAFYMFRIYFLTFEGDFRGNNQIQSRFTSSDVLNKLIVEPSIQNILPHESTWSMVLPLILLSIPTVLIGFLGAPLPNGIPNSSILSHWLYTDTLSASVEHGWSTFIIDALPSIAIGLFGSSIAWSLYGPQVKRFAKNNSLLDPDGDGWIKPILSAIYSWSLRRAYIDEIYENTLVKWTRQLSYVLSWFDQWCIDGLINVSGLLFLFSGEGIRYTESGKIANYIFILTLAFTIILLTLVSSVFIIS